MNAALALAVIGLLTQQPPASAAEPSNEQYLAEIRAQIKGREEQPAREVFKNIQTMQNSTAGRLLRVMEIGFARSLGVSCSHCHTPGMWEDDGKQPKKTARAMSAMVSKVNRELLPAVEGLADRKAFVNCTTCHRGQTKPALDLDR